MLLNVRTFTDRYLVLHILTASKELHEYCVQIAVLSVSVIRVLFCFIL